MVRVELDTLYPYRDNETPSAWTNRVLSHASEHGTYRQCSIGWHDECTQRDMGDEAECMCLCHAEDATLYSVEGHSEDGKLVVTRAEEGKLFWPPQDGEPETMWAWWVLGLSLDDAIDRAKTKQAKILEEKESGG